METIAKKQKSKEWYRINEDVEYSTHFKFFLENQINVVKSGARYSFNSRLEAKEFSTISASYKMNGEIDNTELRAYCNKIHTEILAGKHGEGELVE